MVTENTTMPNGAENNGKGKEAAPQKKKITAVFRPQNSSTSGNGGGRSRGGQGNAQGRTGAGTPGGQGGRAGGSAQNGRSRSGQAAPGQSGRGRSGQAGNGQNGGGRTGATKAGSDVVRRPITEKAPGQIVDRASRHNAEKIDQMLAEQMRREAEEKRRAAETAAREAAEQEAAAAAARLAEREAAARAKQLAEEKSKQTETVRTEAMEPERLPRRVAEEAEPRPRSTSSERRGPAGERASSERRGPQGERAQGDRPYGERRGPQGERAQGDRPYGERRGPQGDGRGPGQRRPAAAGGGMGRGGFGDFAGGKDKDERETRPGQGSGRRGGASAGRSSAPATDGTQKPGSNRKSKPAPRQNDRYEKRYDEEDLKGFNKKGAFRMPQPKQESAAEQIKTIVLPETLTIKELADKMKLQPSVIIKKLFMQGKMVTMNQEIDFATAEEIAMEYDILCEAEVKVNVIEELLKDTEDAEELLQPRPPVICVMGHVDHGKTSLLDAIRQTNVTSHEAGGITQHIGAYTVSINDQEITFLDTPGHEAFTAMRMRGAQSTDIAVLVVAADDGVMPQTVEAINHAKAAGVEVIVAINKIDKPGCNVDRVKQELTEYGLIAEDWGGSTVCVPVSAYTKEGIETLLEMILLTAEVKELRANPDRRARGLIIEAKLDKGKGPVATMLVQKGTLHVGDVIAAGSSYGKVRAMMDDKGRRVKTAGPSTPVEILGFNEVPGAGEICIAMESEKEARSFAETFISEGREQLLKDTRTKMSLDDLFSQIKAGNVKELNLIVKADVQGSVEAVKQSLLKLSNEEVVVKVIHAGVGAINESDVTLASASNAIIIGFNIKPDATAKSIAESEKVDVRLYNVIYQAIEDVEAAMKGMLDPIYEEKVIGHAVVRQIFKASGVGTIAGSYVTDGKIVRNAKVRVSREGSQIFEGPLASLKRFKDDVKEVAKGYECGLVMEGLSDLREDDMIEAYIMVEVPR